MAWRKKAEQERAARSAWAGEDAGFREHWPQLLEGLAGDGLMLEGAPKTATLTLFVEGGQWKACLNDRAEGEVAFVTADRFTALLDALETGLREGSLDWRRANGGKARR